MLRATNLNGKPVAIWRHCNADEISWKSVELCCWICGQPGEDRELVNGHNGPGERYEGAYGTGYEAEEATA